MEASAKERGVPSSPRRAQPEDIKKICLVLTSQCNLRCGYCFQNDKKNGRMEWDTLRASVDLALRTRHDEIEIFFFGGEPLLAFDLVRRATEYAEAHCPPAKELTFGITTNGTRVDEESLDFLVAHWFETQISFDGVAEAQAFRGPGTFERVDRLLDQIQTRHRAFFRRKITVALTLLPQTIHYLADSVRYLLDKGLQKIEISPSFTSESAWKSDQMEEMEIQFSRLLQMSVAHHSRTGEIPVLLFRSVPTRSSGEPKGRTMCGVMRGETPTVDIDGQVHGCATFADSYQAFPSPFLRERVDSMRMGDLRAAEFRERYARFTEAAYEAKIFHGKQDKHSSYRACRDCEYLPSCSVCPMSIGHIPGNLDPNRVPDFLCAFNLVSLRSQERFGELRRSRPLEILKTWGVRHGSPSAGEGPRP